MRKAKSEQKTMDELRARHRFCISVQDVHRDVRAGRIPKYWDNPERYKAYCDYPEDRVCASPSHTEESIKRELKRVQEQE